MACTDSAWYRRGSNAPFPFSVKVKVTGFTQVSIATADSVTLRAGGSP